MHTRTLFRIAIIALFLSLTPLRSQALQLQFSPAPGGLRLGAADNSKASIYRSGWIDLNKNGVKDVYEDPSEPVEKRVEDLLGRMTLQEKIGQLWHGQNLNRLVDNDGQLVAEGGLGSHPAILEAEDRNAVQRAAVEGSRLGIPLVFGLDSKQAEGQVWGQLISVHDSKPVPPGKLDDAVRAVLRAKFLRGLFDQPYIKCSTPCPTPGIAV